MKYICEICNWEYDEEQGYPEGGIAPGTKWENVPEDFECPLCFVGKEQFSKKITNKTEQFYSILFGDITISKIFLCRLRDGTAFLYN